MRNEDAAAVVERALFAWPEIPDVVAHLRIPGVTGRVTAADHPRLNCVGLARLDARDADATIDAVQRVYADAGVRGAWLVGPICTPADLGERLRAHGLSDHGELAGLVLDDLGGDVPGSASVLVREVPTANARAHVGLVARGLDLPPEAAAVFVRAAARPDGRARLFVASLGDDPAPVAFGFLELLVDPRVALLGGAGTLPERRGHGAYRALLRERIGVACEAGATAAIVQAQLGTSAPILRRLHFREVCRIAVYLEERSAPGPAERTTGGLADRHDGVAR